MTVEVLPALVAALNDHDVSVRLVVAEAIKRIGPDASPVLLTGISRVSPSHREAIVNTLGLIGHPLQTQAGDVGELAPKEETRLRHVQGSVPSNRWKRIVLLLLPIAVVLLTLAGFANEVISWIHTCSHVQGVALKVMIGWAALGLYFGAILGPRLGGRLGLSIGAKLLGLGGACAGAAVGRFVGALFDPLIRALT